MADNSVCTIRHCCTIRLFLRSQNGAAFPVDLPAMFLTEVHETLICPVQLHVATGWHSGTLRHYPARADSTRPPVSVIEFNCSQEPPDVVQCIAVSLPGRSRDQYRLLLVESSSCYLISASLVETQTAYLRAAAFNDASRSRRLSLYDWHVIFGHPAADTLSLLPTDIMRCHISPNWPHPLGERGL